MKNKLLSAVVRNIIVTVLSLAVLTGCTKTESLQEEGSGTETGKTQAEDETAEATEDIPQIQSEENTEEVSSIREISTGKDIDWAIWSEGIYCYSDGDLCGYLNEEGDSITPCIYEEAAPFSEGLACVRLNGKYGYIGKDGETVLPFVYDQAASFREGVAYFSCGEEYGLIDREGNVVLELADCDSISSFREGLAYFTMDGQYGYMDKDGNVIVEPIYDDAGYFHDGLAVVIKNGLGGVIGKDGREILQPKYIGLRTVDTCMIAQKGERLYFYDLEGNEISSSPGNQVVQSNDVLYISMDDKMGFADKNGKVILEPIYMQIRPIPEKELILVQNEEYEFGVLDYEGQIVVPFHYYDSVSFMGERAVVGLDEKYGVLRCDGTQEVPIEYDKIRLFSDGSMAIWTGNTVELADSSGNLILTGEYEYLYESGDGYEADNWGSGGKAKFWDKQGNLISEYQYDTLASAFGVENTYIVDGDRILKKGDEDETLLEEVLLTNQITPEVGAFRDFLESGSINDPYLATEMIKMDELRQKRRYCKLFRTGEENVTVLFFHATPLDYFIGVLGGSTSLSGLYMDKNGSAEALDEAGNGGGSMGGSEICFWYDTKKGVLKFGGKGNRGGFGGYASYGHVYKMEQGELVIENSFSWCSQAASNYGEKELLENAELFYDNEGNAYTRENVLRAESVVEYNVNGEQVSAEDYQAVSDRYISYIPLDMN